MLLILHTIFQSFIYSVYDVSNRRLRCVNAPACLDVIFWMRVVTERGANMAGKAPKVGRWYEDITVHTLFQVVAKSPSEDLIAIRYSTGKNYELNCEIWSQMHLKRVEKPSCWGVNVITKTRCDPLRFPQIRRAFPRFS